MFDYSPLWETMKKKGVTQYQLLKGGVDNKTLEKLCRIVGCTPNEVVRFTERSSDEKV